MEYGFTKNGKPTTIGADDCTIIVKQEKDRTLLYDSAAGLESSSMYTFGRIACRVINSKGQWGEVLNRIPDPLNEESVKLREKLISTKHETLEFAKSEIGQPISDQLVNDLIESFARLFPAYGIFDDRYNFLSDDFYGFEPHWPHRDFHNAPNFKTLVQEAFGVYRKDLARRVAKLSGSNIALFSNFKNSLTPEQLIELIDEPFSPNLGGWSMLGSNLNTALEDVDSFNRFSPTVRLKLAKDLLASLEEGDGFDTASTIQDSLVMLKSVPQDCLKRFKSDRTWSTVHNRAISFASDETIRNIDPIVFPSAIDNLDGKSLTSEWKMKVLRTPWEYLRAGSKDGLDNCMGKSGYYTKAKEGKSYCIVAGDERELKAAIEVSYNEGKWEALQFNGKSNAALPNKEELEDALSMLLNNQKAERKPKRSIVREAQNEPMNLGTIQQAVQRQLLALDLEDDLEAQDDNLEVQGELELEPEQPLAQGLIQETTYNEKPVFKLVEVLDSEINIEARETELLDPIEIPPLGELGEEAETEYSFQAVMLDGVDVESELAPSPRILKVGDFMQAVASKRRVNNIYAFPANFSDLEQAVERKLTKEANLKRTEHIEAVENL